jgi:DNA-binding transcriptional ArsR family regulator
MSSKDSKTIGDTLEETKEYHVRYLRAINNPVRRNILRILKKGEMTSDELTLRTQLDPKTLNWHMDMLVHGFCVERKERNGATVYTLTQEGRVVDYVEK